MQNTIAAVLGTFNPVTRAHIAMGRIARAALDIPRENVVYVPAKDRFLRCKKALDEQNALPAALRLSLLRAAAAEESFTVDSCEIDGAVSGYTTDTLDDLASRYGAARVYMVLGADRLPSLHRWVGAEYLFSHFRFLVIPREGHCVRAILADPENGLLPYREHFVEAEGVGELESLSATLVREELLREQPDEEKLRAWLPEATLPLLLRRA